VGRTSEAQKDGNQPASQSGQVFRFGVFEFDARSGELRRDGIKIRLPHQAFQILELLLSRPREVVTRDELRQRLWGTETFVDFEVGLNNAVRKLREALGDSAGSPQFIETLPRHGYRFVGSLQPLPAHTSGPAAGDIASTAPRLRWVGVAAGLAVAAAIAALGVSYARGWRLLARPPVVEIRSLAVLPFDNLTGDPAQEYLPDGITDALTTQLAQIRPLNVISRSTAKRYDAAAKPAPDIGRELRVDALVQGGVVRSGQRLRISARVVDPARDRHIWARSYDGELGDIIALQRNIAVDVAAAIGRQLTPGRQGRSRIVDPAAADAYLKGVFNAGPPEYERRRTAVAYFEAAVAMQPDYAEAYAALAQTQLQFLFMGPLSPRQIIPKAEAAARKAIELDEALPEPHQTLGTILTHFYWKWKEGNEEGRRARQLSGEPVETAGTSGTAVIRTRRLDDAIDRAERERSRDPLSIDAQIDLAIVYRAGGKHDRAIAEFQRALAMVPGYSRTQFQLAATYVLMGRHREAIPLLEAAVKPAGGNPRFLAYLGYAYAAAGRAPDARRVLTQLVSRREREYVSSYGIALIHDVLGEKELALVALERAYEDRAVEFAQRSQYPPFRTIRDDARYDAVMRGVGLPR
jgi:TolB-like protein/DNA-binding winged helix-turn-helix (wHTH) protein/tetratricopeptide (TPR) repeat protein